MVHSRSRQQTPQVGRGSKEQAQGASRTAHPGVGFAPASRPGAGRSWSAANPASLRAGDAPALLTCYMCLNSHRSPALPNMLPGSYMTTGLPTTWPDSHKNRLQLPDKQLERLLHPERRFTQNISARDTRRYTVFALHELSQGRKMPSIKQEAEISPLALVRLLKHSNCVLTYKDQKAQPFLQRSHLHCTHCH